MSRVAIVSLCCTTLHLARAIPGDSGPIEPTCEAGQPCAPNAKFATWTGGPYVWPMQKGTVGRTGLSPHTAPSDLSGGPTWTWQDPHNDVIRATPLIDHEGNLYLATIPGRVYKFNSFGSIVWQVDVGSKIPIVPSLANGTLFTNTVSGHVLALDMETGHEKFRAPPQYNTGGDTASMFVIDNLLISATHDTGEGNGVVIALAATDGSVVWSFTPDTPVYNFQASSPGDGSVVFQDKFGGVYRLHLKDGSLIWRSGVVRAHMMSTAAAVVHDGAVFVVSSYPDTFMAYPKGPIHATGAAIPGSLAAYNLSDGSLLWWKPLEYKAMQAVAVGPLAPGRDYSVVLGIGDNPGLPWGLRMLSFHWLIWAAVHQASLWFPTLFSSPQGSAMLALDARTGENQWYFELPTFQMPSTMGDCKRFFARIRDLANGVNPRNDPLCLPDSSSQPVIGGDGTAYQAWQDGKVYAIRDRNNDGYIDPKQEVSTYDFGDGSQGSLAIAPGLLAAAPCGGGLYVFKS